jgi:hypothetical protein
LLVARRNLPLLCAGLTALLTVHCENASTPTANSSNTIVATISLRASTFYLQWEHGIPTPLYRNNVSVHTTILGSPVPEPVEVYINGELCPDSASYGPLFSQWPPTQIGRMWDVDLGGTKHVVVRGTFGQVMGAVRFPPSLTITSHSFGDTIEPNTDVLLTWTCDADEYYIIAYATDTSHARAVFDTLVVEEQWLLPWSAVSSSAELLVFIEAYNGSSPATGACGNMSGDGIGFLWASCDSVPIGKDMVELYVRGRTAY